MTQLIRHIEKFASADRRQDDVLRNKFAGIYVVLLSLVKIRKYMLEYLQIPTLLLSLPVIDCITVYYKQLILICPNRMSARIVSACCPGFFISIFK